MKQHEKEFFDSINQIIKEELTNKQILKEQEYLRFPNVRYPPLKPIPGQKKPTKDLEKQQSIEKFSKDLNTTLDKLFTIDISGYITREESPTRQHFDQVLKFLNLENNSFEQIINKIYQNLAGFQMAGGNIGITAKALQRRQTKDLESGKEQIQYDEFTPTHVKLKPNEFLGYLIIYKTLRNLVKEEAATSGLNFENFCAYLLGGNKIGGQGFQDVKAKGKDYTCKLVAINTKIRFSLGAVIGYYKKYDNIELILGIKSAKTEEGASYIDFITRTLDIAFLKYTAKNLVKIFKKEISYSSKVDKDSIQNLLSKLDIQSFDEIDDMFIEGLEKSQIIDILSFFAGNDLKTLKYSAEVDNNPVYLEGGILHYNTSLAKELDQYYNEVGTFPIKETLIENFYKSHIEDTVQEQKNNIQNYLNIIDNMMKQVKSIEILTTTGTTDALTNAKTSTDNVKVALTNLEIQ